MHEPRRWRCEPRRQVRGMNLDGRRADGVDLDGRRAGGVDHDGGGGWLGVEATVEEERTSTGVWRGNDSS
jgi:hypothetical protein